MNAYTDRVREFAQHWAQRVGQMSPMHRVTILAGAALVAVVTIGWVQTVRQATEVLLPDRDLSSARRSEALKSFADAKLKGASVVKGQICVPRGQSQMFMAALPEDFLTGDRLSHHRVKSLQDSSLFDSPKDRLIRQELAELRDLENLIRRFEGVEDVVIHFDQVIEDGLKPKRISAASVVIVPDKKARLTRSRIEKIRRIVASSRAGVKLSDVMVSDTGEGWSVGGPGSQDPQVLLAEETLRIQQEVERHWQEKILNVLTMVPGAHVVVNAQPPRFDANNPTASLNVQAYRLTSVSVSVPSSFHMRRLRNPRSGLRTLRQVHQDTEQRIRKTIQGLTENDHAQVVVTTFDDMPAMADASSLANWLAHAKARNWTAAGAFLIAAAGLLIVHITSRSKAKTGPDESTAVISLADELADVSEPESSPDGDDSDLRATLTDRIQNDPDQAVRVLNQWLSRAGRSVKQATEAIRKAAVLVSSLEREVADALLDQLDQDQSQEIRNAILAMSSVEVAEELDTIRDFLNEADAPGCCHDPMAEKGGDSDVVSRNVDTNRSSLDRASDRMIADCLCDELPQTIAVALSQLPTQRASEVVGHLPATVQADVLERLVQLEPTATLDLADVRNDFQSWLTQQLERSMHRAELAARLATILDATGSPTRERIIHNVSTSDARLAKELRHRMTVDGASRC